MLIISLNEQHSCLPSMFAMHSHSLFIFDFQNSPPFGISAPHAIFSSAAAANRENVILSVLEVLSHSKQSIHHGLWTKVLSLLPAVLLEHKETKKGGRCGGWWKSQRDLFCISDAPLWCNSSFLRAYTRIWGSHSSADVLQISNTRFPLCLFKLHLLVNLRQCGGIETKSWRL